MEAVPFFPGITKLPIKKINGKMELQGIGHKKITLKTVTAETSRDMI